MPTLKRRGRLKMNPIFEITKITEGENFVELGNESVVYGSKDIGYCKHRPNEHPRNWM